MSEAAGSIGGTTTGSIGGSAIGGTTTGGTIDTMGTIVAMIATTGGTIGTTGETIGEIAGMIDETIDGMIGDDAVAGRK
jgi:hypothetical protein